MDNQKEAYRIEAYELLAELETSLLELETSPDDFELVDRVFRAMHTIKGSGAMFGFDDIAEFTHDVESVFDMVRDGKMAVTPHLVNLALMARDQIKLMLDRTGPASATEHQQADEILAGFRILLDNAQHDDDCTVNEEPTTPECANENTTLPEKIYRIYFAPHETVFEKGTNPLALLAELADLGLCRALLHTDRLPAAEGYDPQVCYLYWDIMLASRAELNTVQDIFIFIEDDCDLSIDIIETLDDEGETYDAKRLGEILVDRGDLTPEQIDTTLKKQQRIGEMLVGAQQISPGKVEAALAEQDFVKSARTQREVQSNTVSVRVAAEKLDNLVNLVGELVTVQARLSQKAMLERDPELLSITEVVERLTAELRDNTLSIRMLPIDTTFNKLRRLVRDLSRELGKSILLKTEGGDTELDKTVIEQLNDPLVHILRNSIDHGIEMPDQRTVAGKAEQGLIRLRAEHSGANVLIHISDDGTGIDSKHIRRKAIEKGLLAPDAEVSEKELMQLLFAPGFSTVGSVTNVSGRGVGMDVVKRSIENLRGSVNIQSRKGEGTTITLILPLTLAIIDGLLVEIGTDKFVLPLSAIEECVELTREDLAGTHGRNILNIRGQIVPFVPLRGHFGIPGDPPDIEQVVINTVDGQRLGIVVDRVIGEHQIVIKTMNSLYKDVHEVSGATILGDGTVALILDVQKLVKELNAEELAA
ncbi:MAG: chemotaxis protein CheA [Desulfatitalea sp.]|nr:chemotaxis protein CheA [Desulfatitalea sp.]NNK02566.1 chemotaxis protein CheA [Desulfatitalea sp.]